MRERERERDKDRKRDGDEILETRGRTAFIFMSCVFPRKIWQLLSSSFVIKIVPGTHFLSECVCVFVCVSECEYEGEVCV